MAEPWHSDDTTTVYHGDCLEVLAELEPESVDAVVTDPPYGLEFMGRDWDRYRLDDPGTNRNRGDRAGSQGTLDTVTRGGYGRVAYGGGKRPATSRCTACGKRDQFRNPHDCDPDNAQHARWVKVLLDPYAAPATSVAFQEWCRLWSTQCLRVLKPGGHMLAFGGTRTWHRLASAVEESGFEIRDSVAWLYGSGFPKNLNVARAIASTPGSNGEARAWDGWGTALKPSHEPIVVARKPLLDTVARTVLEHGTGALNLGATEIDDGDELARWPGNVAMDSEVANRVGDAARFFYVPKPAAHERPKDGDSTHPTVKPLDLMRWLVRLVTPPGGLVLDPFLGSGTTAEACISEGFRCVGVETEAAYLPLISARIAKPIQRTLL